MPASSSRMIWAARCAGSEGAQHFGSFVMTCRIRMIYTSPPEDSGGGSEQPPCPLLREDPFVAAVIARRVHEPLHDLRLRARRDLARRREDEARLARGGVDAPLHVGVHRLLRR